MYLSRLWINVGDNPDRPRPGRKWLRNLYHVHQRICMAFPSDSRKSDDPDFLKPFKPQDFGSGQVHVKRAASSGFLFRIDPHPNGRKVIIVQSALNPNWKYAFHNACYLLADHPEVEPFNPGFKEGQHLHFRLAANPTRRLSKNSLDADGQPVRGQWIGKRVPVPADQLFEWLACRAESAGFSIAESSTIVQPGYKYIKKKQDDNGKRLRSVRYEGVLKVTDGDKFRDTLISGIGPGKAFGFGLLSVMPVQA